MAAKKHGTMIPLIENLSITAFSHYAIVQSASHDGPRLVRIVAQ